MLTPRIRKQLIAFVVLLVTTTTYGLFAYFDAGQVVRPPLEVKAQFSSPNGIYPRADVDLLGVRVGKVREVLPGPGPASTVVLAIDRGADVPVDVEATVTSKSAIGEQYVQLVPRTAGGPTLRNGDVIPLARTTSPPDLGQLIGSLDSLAQSVPTRDVRTVLREGALALDGAAPSLRRIFENSDQLSRSYSDNAETITSLIRNAQTVLDTQVAVGQATRSSQRDLAGLTTELRSLDPTFDKVFVNGITAGQQVTGLLRDNQAALPVLLNHLLTLTTIARQHVPHIRKSLVVFPWILEYNAETLRHCDDYNPKTGAPVKSTCHYDKDGKELHSAHIANVVTTTGSGTFNPCTKGYEGTKRYTPDGRPINGQGGRQKNDAEPAVSKCEAPPTDPNTPNVRGFQNVPHSPTVGSGSGRSAPAWGTAVLDPESGVLLTPDQGAVQLTSLNAPPPSAETATLGWLLTQNLTD